jgi:hypothetical protein
MRRPIGDANNPVGRDTMVATALWLDTDGGISGIAVLAANPIRPGIVAHCLDL